MIEGTYAGGDVWAEEVTAVGAIPFVADSVPEGAGVLFDDVSVESSPSGWLVELDWVLRAAADVVLVLSDDSYVVV